MEAILTVLLILIYNVTDVLSVTCIRQSSFGYYTYLSCTYGCCGTTYSRYCCPRSTTYMSGGVTAGIVISIVIFLAIAIIISMCYKKKYYGRVLRTGTVNPHASVQVHTTTVSSIQQPYPMYQNAAYPPRPMQPQNPAYPPHPMQPQTQVGAPMNPGYVPAPPAYSAPPPGFSAQTAVAPVGPPPSYHQAQTYGRKY